MKVARGTWLMLLGLSACIVRGTSTNDVPLRDAATPRRIETRVKAHLADGSTVVYPRGLQLVGGAVIGSGTRFGLALTDSQHVDSLPLDSVVAMESFHTKVRPVETVLVSALGVAAAGAVAVGIACAVDPKCFGSCPTVYSDSAGTPVLEAEGFSYSIAPMFERRDVDRLRAQPDPDGTVRLELRNEALETHFINHLELIEVRHGPDEWSAPDPGNRPVAVRGVRPPGRAVDRRGRDVLPDVAAHDGRFFKSDVATVDAATADDLDDWIELEVPVPPGADSVALVFRMRNSLLATVVFYDLMLGDRGLRAIDWMARDLSQIAPAVDLGRWAVEHLGLRLAVFDGESWRPVARIGDSGPVAWKDVIALVPTYGRPVLTVRLSFVADNWRVDRIGVASAWRRPEARIVPLADLRQADGRPSPDALAAMRAPDDRYVETTTGGSLAARFFVQPAGPEVARTFFLASQGYYLEWLRRDWLATGRDSTAFTPGRAALLDAVRRWRATQDETERRFYATRAPVR